MSSFDKFYSKLFGGNEHEKRSSKDSDKKKKKSNDIFLKRINKYRKLKMKVIPTAEPAYGGGGGIGDDVNSDPKKKKKCFTT